MRPALLTALALVAAPLQAQQPPSTFETVTQKDEVDHKTQSEDVRMKKDVNDRMTVPVTLSGSGPFRFLVDTGADRTAVSSAVVARLGLKAGQNAALHTVTGMSSVQTATVPNLQLSSQDLRIVDAPVLEAEHMGADGILGTDSLRSQRVVLDFEKGLMTIVPSVQRVPREEGTIIVTGRLRNGRLIVTDAMADNNFITVVLDTGSEVSVGNEALRLRLANHGLLKSTGAVELESVTGELLQGEYTFVKRLEVGDVALGNLAVVFANAHTFKQLGLENRPALLLGMNALRAFKKVSIDFANKKLRVILPESGALDSVRLAAR
jgi:predicted aspartyl protease